MSQPRQSEPVPQTATALFYDSKTKHLSLQSLPVPVPSGADEHLIEVKCVAITNGQLEWPEPAAQPYHIPGYEVSGVVRIAPEGSPFQPDTPIYARTDFHRAGNARPFSVALTSELGRKPWNLSWREAAAVPLSALTAWQALFVHGGITEPAVDDETARASSSSDAHGQGLSVSTCTAAKRVLVTAAAGGVGIFAVQLARMAGAFVAGTCGPSNVEFVRGLGAHAVVDYRSTPDLAGWAAREGKFDLVIDGVGGETLVQEWKCAREGGMIISIVAPAETQKPADGVESTVRTKWFIVEADRTQLDRITGLIETGKLHVVYDSSFQLAEYEGAFKKLHGGHVRGKVILDVAATQGHADRFRAD